MLEYVRQKLTQFWQLARTHRALVIGALVFAVGAFALLSYAPIVHAQGQGGGATASDSFTGIGGVILSVLTRALLAITRLFLSLTVFILTFIIEVAGYNGYLDANAVNVGWVMVRDLTNMLFIVALLVIAIGTILGIEHYEWKHMLVELVIAAVLVNFSRTICGIIIDAGQVVMNTFVNGIAATATGNLINAFGMNKILQLSQNVPGDHLTDWNIFSAAIAGVFFSSMVMCIMGMFMVMLLMRMVALWVLIVLAPFGFTFRILPQTEKYAEEWWEEFTKNVITGPVLLFFLWLSFVAVGNGRIDEEIAAHSSVPDSQRIVGSTSLEKSSGIGSFLEWNSLANFAVACGMLIVGAEVAQRLGGKGADMVEHGLHTGQHVATIASGLAAAKWGVGKAKERYIDQPLHNVKDTVVGLASTYSTKSKIARDTWLQEKIKAADEKKGVTGALGKGFWRATDFVARSGDRSKALAENYMEMAENAHELHEARISTSSAWSNEQKRRLHVQAHKALEVKKSTGERKEAAMDLELEATDALFQKDEQKIQQNMIETAQMKRKIEGERAQGIGEKQEGMEKTVEKWDKDMDRASELISNASSGGTLSVPEAAELENLTNQFMNVSAQDKATLSAINAKLHAGGTLTPSDLSDLSRIRAAAAPPKNVQDAQTYVSNARELATLDEKVKQLKGLEEGKKKSRAGEAEENLRNTDAAYQARLKETNDVKARGNQFETKFATQRELELLQAIKHLLENDAGYRARNVEINEATADKEQLEFDSKSEKERQIAAARDNRLRADDRHSEAVNLANVMAKQAKERIERQTATTDYPETVQRTIALQQRITDLEASLASGTLTPAQVADTNVRLARLRRNGLDMQMSNLGIDPDVGDGNKGEIFAARGITRKARTMEAGVGHADEIMKMQAEELASLIGEQVDATVDGLDAAMAKLEAIVGPENLESTLDLLREREEKAAAKGSVARAGLFKVVYENGVKKTQLNKVKVKNAAGTADVEDAAALAFVDGRRKNARSSMRLTNISNFRGSVDMDAAGQANAESAVAQEIVIDLATSFTGNNASNINDYSKDTFAEIFDHTSAAKVSSILNQMKSKSTDHKALKTLLNGVVDRIKNTGQKTLVSAWVSGNLP